MQPEQARRKVHGPTRRPRELVCARHRSHWRTAGDNRLRQPPIPWADQSVGAGEVANSFGGLMRENAPRRRRAKKHFPRILAEPGGGKLGELNARGGLE